ncbi:MAG: AmmeMemoRadiSam system radical SAM enzyme [Flexilinea sp.]
MKTTCEICFHHCSLEEGQTGFCGARTNIKNQIICSNYGKLTAVALDPIEKKPLKRFYPGSQILSVGSYGCNLHCSFCQNSDISQTYKEHVRITEVSPEDLIKEALALRSQGNIGIAYTYNEPLISYEYVYDCSRLAHENNLKNVLVTNGTVEEKPLLALLPFIDAMNIDLKGFTESFYKKISGDLETVKRTIALSAKSCHVEITTLVIPRENDSETEITQIAEWIASIDPEIPYHISRFFPQFRMTDRDATDVDLVYHLAEIARKSLLYVYIGNC